MSWLDKLKGHPKVAAAMEKAEQKAKDPAFQRQVKDAVQRKAQQRGQRGRHAFAGGGPNAVGYPYLPGHPMYGQYAHPGFYDDDQNWYDQDSDGDGVPDSQDADPNDPNVQTEADLEQGDPDAGFDDGPGGETTQYDPGEVDDTGMGDVPDTAGDTYDGGGDAGGYDGGGDYGGGDSGGDFGGGGE